MLLRSAEVKPLFYRFVQHHVGLFSLSLSMRRTSGQVLSGFATGLCMQPPGGREKRVIKVSVCVARCASERVWPQVLPQQMARGPGVAQVKLVWPGQWQLTTRGVATSLATTDGLCGPGVATSPLLLMKS